MGLVAIFFLGMANFAMHRAVLESGHPMLGQFSVDQVGAARRLTLLFEFIVLLAAMLLVHHGYSFWGWTYGAYSALNALAAWLILSRRI